MQHIFKFIPVFIMLLSVSLPEVQAQQISKAEKGVFALTNATLVTVANGTIENGTVLIRDGKIAVLGSDVDIPGDAEVIDCTDHYIYPGMIDGGTRLGLEEVGSIDLTQDYNEIGNIIPHMQALTAVNPNAVAIPVTRVNGVTTVIAKPSGGLFPGTASLINLVGYTPAQMYAGFNGVVMNFPSAGRRGRRDRRSEEERNKEREKALEKLNEIWDEALLYYRIDSAARANGQEADYNPEIQALLPVLRGEYPLMLEVNKEGDIKNAISWVQERKVPKVVFTGVAEGWRVAEEIAEAGIPVITGPMLSTPTRSSDRYDRPYANPGIMQKAGVKVALRTDDSENVRNLPYNAGFAAAYGMGKEEALRAVTIVPAEIFGVEDQLGSLEAGKSATLFVATGDPFETKTHISHLFIDGWKVPIDSRHIRLYEEFLERKPGVKK
jgi:imidazolonepropionase-like amidohydrolase